MTPREAGLMQDHAAHWTEWMTKGHVIAFGLVGDPAGPYGVGIVEFPDDGTVQAFTDADPVIKAQAGFRYEVLPMPFGAVHKNF